MKKVLVPIVLSVLIAPAFAQDRTSEVTAKQVLNQLGVLLIVDKTLGSSQSQTLSLVQAVISLNTLQIQHYEATQESSDSMAHAFSSNTSAFSDLRASICKARPHLTQLIDIEGKIKACDQ